ncbi:MAG: outer membrane beta-barrel family protein [Mucilaginibacter sp.]|uniref:outer membrane beta-barrel family protein n=1 Tax=Mucilaginibacter sp. TaxID=1882438 RepID=UPI0032664522
MKQFYILIILLIAFAGVHAQSGKGKITGKVTDAITKAPVEYATIVIYLQGGKSPVNGTTTDLKGNFAVSGLPFGEYQLVIDFIGYKHTTVEHVIISELKGTVVLNKIQLTSSQKQLKDVNITAQKSTVENKIDKLVFNVGNDLVAQSGVATDILKKVPMVSVDIDGNVELLGNPGVKFLINGKPSSMFGASLADALQSIPSSQIKSVEVITSPGAKSDASGSAGIINIILKDNNVKGYNGSINLSGGTRLQNASVNLNVRTTNFGVNAFFSGNETLRSKTLGSRNRNNISGDTAMQNQFQNATGYTTRQGYQSGLRMDWDITKTDNLSASFSYHHFSNDKETVTNQEDQSFQNGITGSDLFSVRNSNTTFGENAFDFSVDYKKTFKTKGQELDISYNSSFNRNTGNFYQKQDYLNSSASSFGSIGDNPGHDHDNEVTIDYAQPIAGEVWLETGAKAQIQNITTASSVNTYNPALNSFVFDPLQSNGFDYGRHLYAYYVSVTFPLFKFFDVKAGLRDEYTITTIANANVPDYNLLSPSLVFSHKLDKTQSIKISYSKRIERPDFEDLNPFVNFSDPYNISYGNPLLLPEIGNNVELGYNHSADNGVNFNVTAIYRHNGNDVKQYTFIQDSVLEAGGRYYKNVYSQTRANVGSEVTWGLNLSGSIPITSKFIVRPNIFVSQRRITVVLPGVSPFVMGYECRLNLNAAYEFKNDYAAEAFVNYNTPRTQLQGKNSSFVAYSFAFRKQFWNKKASIGLTANVPFNEYVNQTSTVTQAAPKYSYQYSIRQVPFRSFGITLGYRFGKLEFKKDKEKDNLQQPSLPDQN